MIVAGFGFRASATRDSLADALRQARPERPVARFATAGDKADHPALARLAAECAVPIDAIPPERLAAQRTATQSPASRASQGTGSVAEAAALAAHGPGARLIAPRAISADRRATCALAWKDTT